MFAYWIQATFWAVLKYDSNQICHLSLDAKASLGFLSVSCLLATLHKTTSNPT